MKNMNFWPGTFEQESFIIFLSPETMHKLPQGNGHSQSKVIWTLQPPSSQVRTTGVSYERVVSEER